MTEFVEGKHYIVESGPLETSCWIWQRCIDRLGYGSVTFRRQHDGAHRLAWQFEHGSIPVGLHVLHRCDNRACVNPAHLFLGTHLDNMRDMIAKGRKVLVRGSAHGNAVLTEAEVRVIRAEWNAGERQVDLAERFGVTQQHISRIVKRKRWAQVA